jgi:hypothetical protein
MAEQLSLFDPPKKAYVKGPPDLKLIYKYLYSNLQRLRNARCMPWDEFDLNEITGNFDLFCPMYEHEGPDMLAEFHQLVIKLTGRVQSDPETWLPEL